MVMKFHSQEGIPPYDYVSFFCVPCNTFHMIPVTGPRAWGFNHNHEKPTITPSIKVSYEYRNGRSTQICHINITDGLIQYHNDCTHDMAGKTVPLTPLPS